MVEYRNLIGIIISFHRPVETYAASNLDTLSLAAYVNCSQIKLNS